MLSRLQKDREERRAYRSSSRAGVHLSSFVTIHQHSCIAFREHDEWWFSHHFYCFLKASYFTSASPCSDAASCALGISNRPQTSSWRHLYRLWSNSFLFLSYVILVSYTSIGWPQIGQFICSLPQRWKKDEKECFQQQYSRQQDIIASNRQTFPQENQLL